MFSLLCLISGIMMIMMKNIACMSIINVSAPEEDKIKNLIQSVQILYRSPVVIYLPQVCICTLLHTTMYHTKSFVCKGCKKKIGQENIVDVLKESWHKTSWMEEDAPKHNVKESQWMNAIYLCTNIPVSLFIVAFCSFCVAPCFPPHSEDRLPL